MTSKRRAELQRKLTLNAVPRPPANLAERIKADIPKYLEAETGAAKLARSMTFHMKIAASVLLVVTSLAVAMLFITRPEQNEFASSATPVIFAPQKRAVAMSEPMTATSAARTEEVDLDIVEEAPPLPQLADARIAPPPSLMYERQVLRQDENESRDANRDDETVVGGESDLATGRVAGGVVGGYAQEIPAQQPVSVAEVAEPEPKVAVPAPAAAPPAEDYAMAPPPQAPSREGAREQIAVTAEAPLAAMRRERAATTGFADVAKVMPKDSVFGISVSPYVFQDIRATLESGGRPAASAVNVEALVNYFAGPPAKYPRNVRLEVEASPAAIHAEGDHAVLRFTIDTPDATSKAPAISNARVEVIINNDVVERARRIGDSDTLASESTLPRATSVTGLYALELKPGLRSSQLIATVRLRYVQNGKPDTITKPVHGYDLAKSWQRSSRRHRLASLGALWGESLKNGAPGEKRDLARRAEELATQAPDDVRARELARAASASAAGGR